jgi:hypothetical protein
MAAAAIAGEEKGEGLWDGMGWPVPRLLLTAAAKENNINIH